eukprot:6208821-Pleurochrysis_carterae.AAC.1
MRMLKDSHQLKRLQDLAKWKTNPRIRATEHKRNDWRHKWRPAPSHSATKGLAISANLATRDLRQSCVFRATVKLKNENALRCRSLGTTPADERDWAMRSGRASIGVEVMARPAAVPCSERARMRTGAR